MLPKKSNKHAKAKSPFHLHVQPTALGKTAASHIRQAKVLHLSVSSEKQTEPSLRKAGLALGLGSSSVLESLSTKYKVLGSTFSLAKCKTEAGSNPNEQLT